VIFRVTGNENRTRAPTDANAASSRSHAVLQIHVKQRPKTASIQTTFKFATLSIIDLAGSEVSLFFFILVHRVYLLFLFVTWFSVLLFPRILAIDYLKVQTSTGLSWRWAIV
jgi:hypothetical protein